MVDAAISVAAGSTVDRIDRAERTAIAVEVLTGRAAAQAYRAASADVIAAPPQSAGWVCAWIEEAKPDAIVALGTSQGMPVFALALEVVAKGPFRIARFMGGRHANGNFPLTTQGHSGPDRDTLEAVIAAIHAARPDVDILVFERLLAELEGRKNPLLLLPHHASPNLALAADLGAGFEALLDRRSGKRKRKRHRSQKRQFDQAGGVHRFVAASPTEAGALLDAFFAMKEVRFRAMGIPDVFAAAETRRFFHALFAGALADEPPAFVLHGLEVGGKLRAVTGSSRRADALVCEFGSIAEDELAAAGPGSFLFFENIKEAGNEGFRLYDFSVGDEPYKRLWCELEITHWDIKVPLTAKGRILALCLAAASRVTVMVKRSPMVWALAKRLRRYAAG